MSVGTEIIGRVLRGDRVGTNWANTIVAKLGAAIKMRRTAAAKDGWVRRDRSIQARKEVDRYKEKTFYTMGKYY